MKVNASQQESLTGDQQLKPTLFVKFVFFAFGVSSLSGWNATLTALDYFADQFKDFNVAFDFPVPMFISSCLMAFILPKLTSFLSLTIRIAWSLLAICVILVLMPFLANQYPNQQGFMMTMGMIFILGLLNSLQSGSALAIASILGGQYVGMFMVGTGYSGAIICIFRMVCLSVTKDAFLSCLVYFCVAAAWNILSFILYFSFQKSLHFSTIENSILKHETSTASKAQTECEALSDNQTDSIVDLRNMTFENKINQMNIFEVVLYVNKIAFPVPLCIILIYIQTFMMFPGMALEKTFPSEWSAWGPTLLIFTYSIGDSVGKQVAGYRNIYNESSQIIIIFLRFGFYVSFYMIVKGQIQAYWFAFVNLFLFAVTNGFATSGMMQIGPEKVPDSMKEKVGFIQGFSLLFGIMLGSFLALPLQYIKA